MGLWVGYRHWADIETSAERGETGNVDFDPAYNPPPLPPRKTPEQRAREEAERRAKTKRPPPRTQRVRF